MIKLTIKKKSSPKLTQRLKRKMRIRRSEGLNGTSDKPRLSVFKSNKYLYVQLIDDTSGKVVAAANSLQKELKKGEKTNKNLETAKRIGTAIAEKAKALNITKAVFDRNGYNYSGKLKAIADAARAAGLKF